jgi:hypothetical protein
MLKTVSSITNAIGALNYKGTWNASTNSPALASGVGTKGDYYVVSVAGSTTLDGISNWGVGDWAVYNGAVWQRVEGGADLNGVNLTFTGTASGPTYETSNLTTGATLTNNSLSADGTDTNIDLLATPKGTGGFGINGAPAGVVAGVAFTSKFCVKNENSSAIGGFVQANNTTASAGSGIFACRSRGTIASPTVVQSGDNLASLFFLGNDGTDLAIAAEIKIDVDGTPGNNDMPGRIVFKVTPDGSEIPAEAMRIHKTTGVSIGNTTDPGATNLSVTGNVAGAKGNFGGGTVNGNLTVTQSVAGNLIGYLINNSVGTSQYGLAMNLSNDPNNNSTYFLECTGTVTNRTTILSNGGIQNYQANNVNLSDINEKKNISLAKNYLDKICAIPVKTFLYNDQTDTELNLGVIAQDVQAVAPELVRESDWGAKNTPKIRLAVYQTDLQYALMKAIQELNAKVTALEKQVLNLGAK